MKQYLLLCLFCLSFVELQAQQTWLRGQITDENQHPLAYVSIGVPGTAIGTVSRPDGSFQLFVSGPVKLTDSLRISHLSYKTLNLALLKVVGESAKKLSFVLQPAPRQLATVEIRPAATKTRIFGSRRENTVISTNFAISGQPFQNLGAAIGKPFNLKGKAHFLKQLNVFVAYNTFDTLVFRLQIQKIKNGKPAGNLLPGNIYWTLTNHRKGWAALDLEPYSLVFKEKVLVSLEWVGHSEKGKYLGIPLVMPVPGAVHYYRFGSQNNWKIYPAMSTSINLVTETAK